MSRSPLAILRTARELIVDPAHWSPDGIGKGHRLCAEQALGRAAVINTGRPEWYPYCDALERLRMETGRSIGDFNDSHSHAEVLAAFDKAISVLEAR
jgi:hypothetical protein